ncbi:Dipeptidase 1 [Acipenser ruthenus]|uniref:Dipeptidase n=1 Tax=Acipenser ruthenus TaxID=7906 RepID=A0A444TWH6_ACIRT|nr:Dipeptidase 1 [Acipenser ruthenus]
MYWRLILLNVLSGFINCSADINREKAERLMAETPLIDGHNDLPWQMRQLFNNELEKMDLNTLEKTHTNIPKIKAGHLSAQFWAAYVPCESQYKDAVRQTVEQIDVVHRLCRLYPNDLMFARSTDDNWLVDTGKDTAINNGLSDFGKELIKEMNRIGMLIDLAHVSEKVMNLVLELSNAPVIFSHSSAYEVCNSKRNVPDDVLLKVASDVFAQKKGIVMVNFYNDYVTCQKTANLSNVADHFDHIKKVAGHEIIGFGGDYDGVTRVPKGLEDVSKYPDLVAELLRRGWTDIEVKAALGNNLLRVFKEVEKVRDSMSSVKPYEVPIPYADVVNPCRTMYGYPPQDNAGSMVSLGLHLPVLTLLLHGTIVWLF